MKTDNLKRIKSKIISIESSRWWGDDFDVRFYLISQIKALSQKIILDLGGGIGIISSEVDKSNFRINLDSSFSDLLICKNKVDSQINNICASMTNLPLQEDSIEYVICANLLEEAKKFDIEKKANNENHFPTVEKTLKESYRILKKEGKFFATTPNNEFYNTTKLSYSELKESMNRIFDDVKINFYNTHKRLKKKSRKLNMANIIPKLSSKFQNYDNVINSLIKSKSKNNYSISFYVEATCKKT